MNMTTDVKNQSRGQQTVLLESSLGDVEYTFVFSTAEFADVADRFAATISQQAQAAQTKQVREVGFRYQSFLSYTLHSCTLFAHISISHFSLFL
jgi:hypothetical protein